MLLSSTPNRLSPFGVVRVKLRLRHLGKKEEGKKKKKIEQEKLEGWKGGG